MPSAGLFIAFGEPLGETIGSGYVSGRVVP
ncbi:hypothetical protein X770_04705 [Mesorhizobium sp. LSJC269B00]|nr:hypothetical protein X770_04705 [Mesorhizobium sp. LSJC269B00]ESZ09296.1 hypothetical protein X736_02565 [Mesorhizobium sp. L2C089B000]